MRAAQAHALLAGRDYCLPDDVKTLAVPVLAHRVVPSAAVPEASSDGVHLVTDLLERTAVPA
jgi:MoxR-like ATPase